MPHGLMNCCFGLANESLNQGRQTISSSTILFSFLGTRNPTITPTR